jgi:hypothetical protein
MCRLALEKFRTFLRQERGCATVTLPPVNPETYGAGLPAWLVQPLTRYQHLLQRNWRPARLRDSIARFWSQHTRMWRWLLAHYPLTGPGDLQRAQVYAYLDHQLAAGYATSSINQDLRHFQAFLRFLQRTGHRRAPGSVPHSLPQGSRPPAALFSRTPRCRALRVCHLSCR